MKAEDKLRVSFSKRENELVIGWPTGTGTQSDGHWLSGIFDITFTDELKRRGYDITTLRFSVEPLANNERFTSQRKSKEE